MGFMDPPHPEAGRGRFKPGFDPRRRMPTKADCKKGYLVATQLAKMPSRVRAWLRNKIKRYYAA
jgi:hypothetical protein